MMRRTINLTAVILSAFLSVSLLRAARGCASGGAGPAEAGLYDPGIQRVSGGQCGKRSRGQDQAAGRFCFEVPELDAAAVHLPAVSRRLLRR